MYFTCTALNARFSPFDKEQKNKIESLPPARPYFLQHFQVTPGPPVSVISAIGLFFFLFFRRYKYAFIFLFFNFHGHYHRIFIIQFQSNLLLSHDFHVRFPVYHRYGIIPNVYHIHLINWHTERRRGLWSFDFFGCLR